MRSITAKTRIVVFMAVLIVICVALVFSRHPAFVLPLVPSSAVTPIKETSVLEVPNEARQPVETQTQPASVSPGATVVSESKSDAVVGDASEESIDYAALSTTELNKLWEKSINELNPKAYKEHQARLEMGLGEYVGEGPIKMTNVTLLTAYHDTSVSGYFKTELPKDEYSEIHAAFDKIREIESEIASRARDQGDKF